MDSLSKLSTIFFYSVSDLHWASMSIIYATEGRRLVNMLSMDRLLDALIPFSDGGLTPLQAKSWLRGMISEFGGQLYNL